VNEVDEDEEAAATSPVDYEQYETTMPADELRREEAAINLQRCARGFLARRRVQAIRSDIYN